MIYEFGSDVLRCQVSTLGAELISVVHNGKERLWQNESGYWNGHAPILFPYGGNCAVMVDGVLYPEQKHGFISAQRFSLHEKTADSVTLCFSSNEETRRLYPFDFSLFVTYLVAGNCLKITYKAVNDGQRTMYAGFGCHESYALDVEAEDCEVVFEKEEKLLSLMASGDNGKLTGETVDLGEGKVLPLPKRLLNPTVILQTNSRAVSLRKRGEEKLLARVSYPDFSNLLIWAVKRGKMVCIEPWQNLPDEDQKAPQELCKKQGLTAIAAGETLTAFHEITYF